MDLSLNQVAVSRGVVRQLTCKFNFPEEICTNLLFSFSGLQLSRTVTCVDPSPKLERKNDCDQAILTLSLTAEQAKRLSAVRVACESHDQGWATGPGSWTWLELATETSHQLKPMSVKRMEVARNRRADDTWQMHERWITQEELRERCLLPDESPWSELNLMLVCRSSFPGWSIYARNASLQVYFRD